MCQGREAYLSKQLATWDESLGSEFEHFQRIGRSKGDHGRIVEEERMLLENC